MSQPIVPGITDEQIAEIEVEFGADSSRSERMEAGGYWADHIILLIARLRAAEKDAARYRFIRNEETRPGFLASDPDKAKWLDEYLVCGDKMDAKIDLEMERSK